MTETAKIKNRPRSPHLSIYRWPITMVISITHRITGIALYFGMVLFVTWLAALACGVETFRTINRIFGSSLGLCVLFLYTLAGVHHTVGSIRHLIWDLKPHLLDKEKANVTAWVTICISVSVTLIIWIVGYSMI